VNDRFVVSVCPNTSFLLKTVFLALGQKMSQVYTVSQRWKFSQISRNLLYQFGIIFCQETYPLAFTTIGRSDSSKKNYLFSLPRNGVFSLVVHRQFW
jgi:hypothetical protein